MVVMGCGWFAVGMRLVAELCMPCMLQPPRYGSSAAAVARRTNSKQASKYTPSGRSLHFHSKTTPLLHLHLIYFVSAQVLFLRLTREQPEKR